MSASMLPVVILVGGLATRLRPLTETVPKALLTVRGEPFIAHQLRLLQRHHVRDVVLCTGYLGTQIEAYVGDGERFGLQVRYSYDGAQPLGTAGAIKQALPLLDGAFFVLYGDSYLPCDYAAVQQAFLQQHKMALMTVFKNNGLWDSSNVEFAAGAIIAYDKKQRTERMHYIDYGLGVLQRDAFTSVPAQTPYDLAYLYAGLLKDHQLAAYEVTERFYEAGSLAGMQELEKYLT